MSSVKPAMTEREFQQQVVDLAGLTGWLVYHTHDSRHSAQGWPDLVLVRPPELIFAELKTETGRLSTAQKEWLEALTGSGQRACVWRPADFDAIVAALARRFRA